jgi:hypothetical protein
VIIFANFELPALHKAVEVALRVGVTAHRHVDDVLAVDAADYVGNVEDLDGRVRQSVGQQQHVDK